MRKTKLWAMALTVGLMLAFICSCVTEHAQRLDKETLKSWLSDPQVTVVDVRAPKDWDDSAKKIKGAVRQDSKEVKTWSASLPPDKKIVLYCA